MGMTYPHGSWVWVLWGYGCGFTFWIPRLISGPTGWVSEYPYPYPPMWVLRYPLYTHTQPPKLNRSHVVQYLSWPGSHYTSAEALLMQWLRHRHKPLLKKSTTVLSHFSLQHQPCNPIHPQILSFLKDASPSHLQEP